MAVLFPECYTEKFICEYIGYSKMQYIKCNGKPDVIKKLSQSKSIEILIGFVDQDPMEIQSPEYFSFVEIERGYGMRLMKKRNKKNQFLIEFNDEFEPWIISLNKKAKVKPGNDININSLSEYKGVELPTYYIKFLKKIFEKYPEPIDKIKQWIAQCESSR